MNICNICGGAILEPNKIYGYSGPVCHGHPDSIGNLQWAKPFEAANGLQGYTIYTNQSYDKEVERLKKENAKLRSELERYKSNDAELVEEICRLYAAFKKFTDLMREMRES